jgi:hypothetical protein
VSRWREKAGRAQTREERMCLTKKRFDSWSDALPVALAASRVAPQRIYQCDYCTSWHLTSHQAITVPKQKAATA